MSRRVHMVQVRLSCEEHSLLAALAEAQRITLEQLIRCQLGFREAVSVEPVHQRHLRAVPNDHAG